MEGGIDNAGADIEMEGGLDRARSSGLEDLSTIAVKELELSSLESSHSEKTPSTKDDDEEINQSCGFLGNALEKFWGWLGDIFSERSDLMRCIIYSIIAILYNAYFIASVYYSIHNGIPMDWCDGVGFLIVLTGLTYIGLFYFQVVKKFWGKAIYRSCMKPMGKAFDRAWKIRSVFILCFT